MAGNLLLGVDIGTYSSKGVLCTPGRRRAGDGNGRAWTEHPRPGWAEHDADAIWWGEFVDDHAGNSSSGKYSGEDVGAVAVSAIGACMLPVDAGGSARFGRACSTGSTPARPTRSPG